LVGRQVAKGRKDRQTGHKGEGGERKREKQTVEKITKVKLRTSEKKYAVRILAY